MGNTYGSGRTGHKWQVGVNSEYWGDDTIDWLHDSCIFDTGEQAEQFARLLRHEMGTVHDTFIREVDCPTPDLAFQIIPTRVAQATILRMQFLGTLAAGLEKVSQALPRAVEETQRKMRQRKN